MRFESEESEEKFKVEGKRSKLEKVPLGIVPSDIWENKVILERTEERIKDLEDTIIRRQKTKQPVPREWLEELETRLSDKKELREAEMLDFDIQDKRSHVYDKGRTEDDLKRDILYYRAEIKKLDHHEKRDRKHILYNSPIFTANSRSRQSISKVLDMLELQLKNLKLKNLKKKSR